MNEKMKSAGIWVLSLSLLCLAFSIIYVSLEARQWRKELPELLHLTEETVIRISPAISDLSEVGKLVPRIMDEVKASRKTVEKTVEEINKLGLR